jgi:hypothetical protein
MKDLPDNIFYLLFMVIALVALIGGAVLLQLTDTSTTKPEPIKIVPTIIIPENIKSLYNTSWGLNIDPSIESVLFKIKPSTVEAKKKFNVDFVISLKFKDKEIRAIAVNQGNNTWALTTPASIRFIDEIDILMKFTVSPKQDKLILYILDDDTNEWGKSEFIKIDNKEKDNE